MSKVERARTAIGRGRLSRPLSLAWEASVLSSGSTITDYGCGRGDDIRHLRALGIDAVGWDPEWRPDGEKRRSSVVNLGYVLNVIERPRERVDTLRAAWALAEDVLIVAALVAVETAKHAVPFGDGVLTSRGTFQKYFDQGELERLIHSTLEVEPIALGVGVFAVIRDAKRRAAFAATRFRRRVSAEVPQVTAERLFDAHRAAFEPVLAFVEQRGRLPGRDDPVDDAALVDAFGSLRRALVVARKAMPDEWWEAAAQRAREDLMVYLALARFGGQPKASDLDDSLRGDISVFFGSYAKAKAEADGLLTSLGDVAVRREAAKAADVGKVLPDAFYVHVEALDTLPVVLRLYEGCARRYLGGVEGANLVKLRLDAAQISYLSYPDFDRDPHPALAWSLKVDLQSFRVRLNDFSTRENPPILHRKETFVGADYPRRDTFARLTRQEEKWGLLEGTRRIGTRAGWEGALERVGVELRGHRVVRRSG